MMWTLVDSEHYFDEERTSYAIKKGSKGIVQCAFDIKLNDFIFIYDRSRQQIEQIYRVTETAHPLDDDKYPISIGISFVDKIDVPIAYEDMERLNPKSKYKKRQPSYVDDPTHRAIAKITNQDDYKRFLLEKNNRFSELVRLLT